MKSEAEVLALLAEFQSQKQNLPSQLEKVLGFEPTTYELAIAGEVLQGIITALEWVITDEQDKETISIFHTPN